MRTKENLDILKNFLTNIQKLVFGFLNSIQSCGTMIDFKLDTCQDK